MSLSVTSAQIKAIAGSGARTDMVAAVVAGWPNAVGKARLTTKNRAAHFLAQIMTETGGLRILEESGAYSAARISQIFGVGHHSAAVTPEEARRIAALPVAQRGPVLFNRVYGPGNPRKMREFNNTGPNDGWLYRGGGMMQCTGKSNYAAMAKKTGLPLVEHPELLHSPGSAFTAAYLEWAQDGRCNAAADRDDVTAVRRIINGGSNGLAECRGYLAKAKQALADYGGAVPALLVEPEAEPEIVPVPEPRPEEAPPNVQPLDPAIDADPVLLDVQQRLKARRYPPGILDGKWGSGTRGALSGFMGDRGHKIAIPTSLAEFHAIAEEVREELLEAETEVQPDGSIGWYRPVSVARANADPKIVQELAPEVVPATQTRNLTAWGAFCATIAGIYKSFSDTLSGWWDFLFDHKDDIPTDPSLLQSVWGWVTGLPSEVWIFAGAIGLVFVSIRIHGAVKKITEGVTTGARQ